MVIHTLKNIIQLMRLGALACDTLFPQNIPSTMTSCISFSKALTTEEENARMVQAKSLYIFRRFL